MSKVIVLVLLLVLVAFGAVPGYWTGNWTWARVPNITNLKQIKSLQETGLNLPGWQTLEQELIILGGHKWSYQKIQGEYPEPIALLLRPPNGHEDQPQVEWVDIDGEFKWKTDSHSQINFTVGSSPQAKIEAHFFRAYPRQILQLNYQERQSLTPEQQQAFDYRQQTFAVVQWYATPRGGNPAINQWFWADQKAQLRRQRVPWVGVCLQIPIEPLGNLEASRSLATSVSKIVQTTLMAGPFAGASSPS